MAKVNNVGVTRVIVSPDIGHGWIVERTGPRSYLATYRTEREALAHARELLAMHGGELEVRGGAERFTEATGTKPKRRRATAQR